MLDETAQLGMDATPPDRDREDAGGPGGADVERRVADVDGLLRRAAELLDREQDGLGLRLVAFGVLVCDDDVERARERRKAIESERHRPMPLRSHQAELTPLLPEPREDVQ